ncbi:MAG: AI-2E family transporter [Solirubrobacterales bacterium]|nr:AI-2E family transporter [Solirubrobacterales bacterium]MBV9942573.1 AI-2E family transporter [Solirubrobacterales bacterium]
MAFRFSRRPGGAEPPEPGARDEPLEPNGDAALHSARDEPLEPSGGETLDSGAGERPTGPRSTKPSSGAPLTQAGVPMGPVVVPRWVQLVILPLALLALWALARAAGTVVLILLAASTIALILNPLVRMLVRRGIPRGLAIFLLYVAVFAFVGGLGVVLANPVSTQVSHLERDVPHFIDTANRDLATLQRWLDRRGIHVQIQQQGQTALQTLQHNILKRSSAIVTFSRDLLTQIVTTSFDLVLTFVLSIYLLVYGDEIGRLVRRIMPPGDDTPEDDYPLLIQRAVFGYVRGQFLFSLIMGASATVALWIFGAIGIFPDGERYAIFFGAFYGLMEFIPYIGPIIGPLPAVLVALFVNPISAVWVILLFVGLQQLEGHVVAPQVFRISLRINPILVILALLIGYQLYGIVGALLALPVSAVIRQTVLYLQRHLVLEPWGTLGSGVISRAGGERCAECGASAAPQDAYCRSCGASLEPRVRTPR